MPKNNLYKLLFYFIFIFPYLVKYDSYYMSRLRKIWEKQKKNLNFQKIVLEHCLGTINEIRRIEFFYSFGEQNFALAFTRFWIYKSPNNRHQMALESQKYYISAQNQKQHRTVSSDFFRKKNQFYHFIFISK